MTAIVVREATPLDLPAIAKLLAERDREDAVRAVATEEVVARQLFALDPTRCRAFVAVTADGRVVAMNAALLRTLRHGERTLPAAYWTNLYVHPEHRNAMLYPRVVAPLRQAMKREGRLLYAAVRREGVVKAHERLGFRRIAELPLLVKPLRPMRLAAKRVPVAQLLRPLDALWSLTFRAQGAERIDDVAAVAELLSRAAGSSIATQWTARDLAERLVPAFAGDVAGIHGLRDGDRLRAAVLWQDATRMHGIRFRVILDLVSDDPATARRLLAACERDAIHSGCDAMLRLGAKTFGYLSARGHYTLLADGDVAAPWRFPLLDHDAF